METSTLEKRIEAAYSGLRRDHQRLDRIDRYSRGRQASPFLPRRSNPEFKDLAKRAINNLIPLIVDAPVNTLQVEGYVRGEDKKELPPEWEDWTLNRLNERQSHIHRAALESGHSFVTVLPDPTDGSKPKVRGYHALNFTAHYVDPAFDEFPIYALYVDDASRPAGSAEPVTGFFIDDQDVYDVSLNGDKVEATNRRPHGLGVCPVVRFAPQLDLMGRSKGLVEPIMPTQDRINQINLNALIAQHYTSFMIRFATGLAPVPLLDANGNEQYTEDGVLKVLPPVVDPSTMLVSPDPNTKFGAIPGGSTKDMQDGLEQSIRHMCMVTQTPPHYLLGQIANLSADALAAAESAFMRRISEIQSNFGEAWAAVLRLCALIRGDRKGFEDTDSLVMWADKGNRSLAQSADAGLKLTQMGIPAEIVLRKMPGFSETDIEEAVKLMEERKEEEEMVTKLTEALNAKGAPNGDKAPASNAASAKPSKAA
ncbi:phage portal protein [Streptomyces sp. NPDC127112]|uniref:phage portal protein n=1 Tax=Streptomyces sp. NPDC127112 TaxID=3345364 RepID=UPI00363B2CCE